MLAIDETAVEAIRTIVESRELPDGAGLRILARSESPEQPELGISIEPRPLEGDQVVEEQDVLVFLEPAAATFLDDKLLGAETDDAGQTRFVVQLAA